MTFEDAQKLIWAECDALCAAMIEKGVVRPIAIVQFQSGESGYVSIQGGAGFPHPGHAYFYGPRCVTEARDFVAALPDPAVRAMQNHRARVADCIDKGRADGIDDAYIAPLAAVKKAMSDNLLAAPEVGE